MKIKNVVFDLAGVVFARNEQRCPRELMEYFSYINSGEPMPSFWIDYDRGTRSMDDVARCLAEYRQSDFETARDNMAQAILYQEEIPATKALIADLKAAGYRLFVLSNMSKEYIEFLRQKPVYSYFEGEIISCETATVKPEAEIYLTLLQRYDLDASQTIFIDDRRENVEAAAEQGICPFHFNRLNPDESCEQLRKMLL